MMAPRPFVVFIFLLFWYNQFGSSVADDGLHWVNETRVIFTVQPHITCTHSSIRGSTLVVDWVSVARQTGLYRIQLGDLAYQDTLNARIPWTDANSTITIRLVQQTSQGEAVLPVTFKFDRNSVDFSVRQLRLIPELNHAGDEVWSYRLDWISEEVTEPVIVLVYNSTHVTQHETTSNHLLLRSLQPATWYRFCVSHSKSACNGRPWSCITRMTSLTRRHTLPTPSLPVRHLTLIHVTHNSIQLNWLPPQRSLRFINSEAPRCYLISIEPEDQTDRCSVQVYYLQAPWIQSSACSVAADAIRRNLVNCGDNLPRAAQIQPMGTWPDWEKSSEQLDQWGPYGDFTVTLSGLKASRNYVIHVWPVTSTGNGVNSSVHVTTKPLEDHFDIRLDKQGKYLTIFPSNSVKEIFLTTPSTRREAVKLIVAVHRIGKPLHGSNLVDSCFVKGCASDASVVGFRPQPHGSPQRIQCIHRQVLMGSDLQPIGLPLDCLLPCVVYEAHVSLVGFPGSCEDCQIRMRFTRSGRAPQAPTVEHLTALSQDLFSFDIQSSTPDSTHDYCSEVGYVVTLSDPEKRNISDPVLLTRDDLTLGIQVPLRPGNPHVLMLSNPLPRLPYLQLSVQPIPVDQSLKGTVVLPLYNVDSGCFAHCSPASIPPFNFKQKSSTYPPYTSRYAIDRGEVKYAKCEKHTISSGALPTSCGLGTQLLFSDHAYCQLDQTWGTCPVPFCTELAPLPCVPELRTRHVNATELQFSWPLDDLNQVAKPQGYAVTLSVPTRIRKRGSSCIAANLLLDPSASSIVPESKRRFLNALLHTCPDAHTTHSTVMSGEDVLVTFVALAQNHSYEVRVVPFDRDGLTGATRHFKTRTKPAAPCAPEHPTVIETEPRALKLNFSEPTQLSCGKPTEIQVYYRTSSATAVLPRPFKLLYAPSVRLGDLLPCQNYCVGLQFVNEVGAGPISEEKCAYTKRPAFTQHPEAKFHSCTTNSASLDIHLHDQSSDKQVLSSDDSVGCRLSIELDYAPSCPLLYEVSVSVHNSKSQECRRFAQRDVIVTDTFSLGLLYDVRVRALSTDHSQSKFTPCAAIQDNTHTSAWSPMVQVFTGTSQIKVSNILIDIRSPSAIGKVNLCVSDKASQADHSYLMVPSGPEDLCFDVQWDLAGRPRGLMGLVLMLYGNSASGVDDTALEPCLRAVWIPCTDCVDRYSLFNADRTVWTRLQNLLDTCSNTDADTATTFSGDSNKLRHSETSFDSLLHRLHRISRSHVALNRTTINLMLNISNSLDGNSKGRVTRSMDSRPATPVTGGSVVFYAVTAEDVQLVTTHRWHVAVPPESSALLKPMALSGLIVGVIVVLGIFLWLLIAFDYKRRRLLRHSNLQRMMDFGISAPDEEEAAFQMEMKKPTLPPRISKFLLRQPDPISIQDFVTWYEKQKYNNFPSIREEFKALHVHSLRQMQAKHLTHDIGQRPENRLRNKYRNLVPFDHNYVHLLKFWRMVDINPTVSLDPTSNELLSKADGPTTDGTTLEDDFGPEQWIASDYVNASHVPGRAPCVSHRLVDSNVLPRSYIAAQAPTPHTKGLFWQMIWDHGIKLIVMLTRLKEDAKEKCVQYCPEAFETDKETHATDPKTLHMRHLTVKLLYQAKTPVYVKRKFSLSNSLSPDRHPRTVTQLQMTQWPDFSAPSNADFSSFLNAYWIERRCCVGVEPPVLVHCSAGVGRTGTFICLDQLCQQTRFYLQPDFHTLDSPSPLSGFPCDEEPVYANVQFDLGDDQKPVSNGTDAPGSQDTDQETPAVRQSLLRSSSDTRPRRRRFGLGRQKNNFLDVYKTVLWLRSHRSFMVQSEVQYLFIYQYLAYFIQKLSDSEQIYVNI